MPGPLVHRASAMQLCKLLRGAFALDVRHEWYMRPDIMEKAKPGSHAGYNAVTMSGSLVDAVMARIDAIKCHLRDGKRNLVSMKLLEAQHLICDAHMVTQITPSLAKYDTLMDGLAEFVYNKDGDCRGEVPEMFGGFRESLENSIRRTYAKYAGPCERSRVRFVFSDLGPMTRRCVERGAVLAYYAYQEACK